MHGERKEGFTSLTHTHSQRDHTHLGRRDEDAAQSVQPGGDLLAVALHQTGPQPHGPGGQPPGPEVGRVLQVEHGQGGAEEVGEVVQQHQAVAQPGHGQTLQVVELHGHRRRQATRAHRLVGGPGQAVGRAARHPVDLLACEGGRKGFRSKLSLAGKIWLEQDGACKRNLYYSKVLPAGEDCLEHNVACSRGLFRTKCGLHVKTQTKCFPHDKTVWNKVLPA